MMGGKNYLRFDDAHVFPFAPDETPPEGKTHGDDEQSTECPGDEQIGVEDIHCDIGWNDQDKDGERRSYSHDKVCITGSFDGGGV